MSGDLNERFWCDARDFDITQVLSSLRRNGYVIIEDVLREWELESLKEEIAPHLAACEVEDANKFMGNRTKRFGRLMFRLSGSHALAMNSVALEACDHFLLDYASTYQLHFTGVMHVMPGQKAQRIHQDVHPFGNPCPPLIIASMWAISDFTKENGATIVVPGSHLWDEDREAKEEEKVVAEMSAGSVLLYFANTHHGAGENISEVNRTGLNIQYSVSWLRQEENQYLAVPMDAARNYPKRIKELLGYDLASRHWGYVDQTHPMEFLEKPMGYGVGGIAPEGMSFEGKIRLDITENGIYPVTKKENNET